MAKPSSDRKPRVRGRVADVPVPSTEKSRVASRSNAYKSGLYAKKVALTPRHRELEKKVPGFSDVLGRFHAALEEQEFGALTGVNVGALAEAELLRRMSVDSIRENGVLVESVIFDKDRKRVVGTEKKANPLLREVVRLSDMLGQTAEQQLLTKKSRGEGARDAAMTAALLARNNLLRRADKTKLPPPPAVRAANPSDPPPIDVDSELVK